MRSSRITSFALVLTVIVALNAWIFQGALSHWLANGTGRVFAPFSVSVHRALAVIGTAVSRRDLARENLDLREQWERAKTSQAREQELERENAFLRTAIGIRDRIGPEPILAGIFSRIRDGGVRLVTVNKGRDDQVSVGAIVITASGHLVGAVQEVYDRHAVVREVGDPALEITAKVIDSEVSGLVRMDARHGLVLDLVQKSESASEGQTVMTSGNDQFPPGLIIGTIRSIDNDSATLFKIIRISPAVDEQSDGRVLIIRP